MRRLLIIAAVGSLCACHSDATPSVDDLTPADAATENAADGAPSVDAKTEAPADASADAPADASVDAAVQPLDAAEAGSDSAVPPRQPALSELLERYRAWSPHPAMPQAISTEIFNLCRLPTTLEQSFADSEHGDGRYLQDWLNDSARSMFESKRTPFAVGAAIVKEKLASDSTGKLVLAARGLMIKREPGFDPAHGDWEFGYWEPAAGLSSGPETARACGGCHASSKTDFVFLDQTWRRM